MGEEGKRKKASPEKVACVGCNIVSLFRVTLAQSRAGTLEVSWVTPQSCPNQGQRGQSILQLLLRYRDQGFSALLCMQAKWVLAA